MPLSRFIDPSTPFTIQALTAELSRAWTSTLRNASSALPAIEEVPFEAAAPSVRADPGGYTVRTALQADLAADPKSRAVFAGLVTAAVGRLAFTPPEDLRLLHESRRLLWSADPRDRILLHLLPGWMEDHLALEDAFALLLHANGIRFLADACIYFREDLGHGSHARIAVQVAIFALVNLSPHLHPLAHLELDGWPQGMSELQEPGTFARFLEAAGPVTASESCYHESFFPANDRFFARLGMEPMEKLGIIGVMASGRTMRFAAAVQALPRLRRFAERPAEIIRHALRGPDLLAAHPAQADREDPTRFFLALEEAAGRKLTPDELERFVAGAQHVPALVQAGWLEPVGRRLRTHAHGSHGN